MNQPQPAFPVLLAALVILFTAAAAPSQTPCEAEPNQLLSDCSFETWSLETGLPSGWLEPDAESFGPLVGMALAGSTSMAIDSNPAMPLGGPGSAILAANLRLESTCFGPAPYGSRAAVSVRLISGTNVLCTLAVVRYDGASCSGITTFWQSEPLLADLNTWTEAIAIAPTTVHASERWSLHCFGDSDSFTVQVDEASLIDDVPIFVDGFETGDTTSWQ